MAYDGPEIYLAPYGNDAALTNFQNTVIEGIPVEQVEPHVDNLPVDKGPIRLWGVKSTLDGTWSSIESGDYVLFYRDGEYTHAVEVISTARNESVAREIWPNFEDEPWSRLIFFGNPQEIHVPSKEVHGLAGYDRDFPLGFSPLNEMGLGGIRGKYGSIEAFVVGDSNHEEPEIETIDVERMPTVELDEEILDGLYFPDDKGKEILDQVTTAVNAGKHVIFTGPPGTGKTEIARRVSKELVHQHPGVYSGFQMTTATADWSTFETVGGYMPTETENEELLFEPGQVLQRFKRNNQQRNEMLIIDEINRADIDKAFGQLFTLLSGQAVQLPYRRDGKEITITPAAEAEGSPDSHEYVMPSSWRLFATMNTYDKTSLYELSYAFMRRFSFIHVDAPEVPAEESARISLLKAYTDEWKIQVHDEVLAAVSMVWRQLNTTESERKIGPAIVEDMLRSIESAPDRSKERAITNAVGNYVLPQLEGSPRREATVKRLAEIEAIDRERLGQLGRDLLRVQIE